MPKDEGTKISTRLQPGLCLYARVSWLSMLCDRAYGHVLPFDLCALIGGDGFVPVWHHHHSDVAEQGRRAACPVHRVGEQVSAAVMEPDLPTSALWPQSLFQRLESHGTLGFLHCSSGSEQIIKSSGLKVCFLSALCAILLALWYLMEKFDPRRKVDVL
jgi:hypothetical protein